MSIKKIILLITVLVMMIILFYSTSVNFIKFSIFSAYSKDSSFLKSNFGKNFITTFCDKIFLIKNEYFFKTPITSSAFLPPNGSTYALAIFKSWLILTSVTVIVLVSKFGTLASFFIKIMLKDCLIISPTLSCLCVIGFPILSVIKSFYQLMLHYTLLLCRFF